jgi:hypothetical protein
MRRRQEDYNDAEILFISCAFTLILILTDGNMGWKNSSTTVMYGRVGMSESSVI